MVGSSVSKVIYLPGFHLNVKQISIGLLFLTFTYPECHWKSLQKPQNLMNAIECIRKIRILQTFCTIVTYKSSTSPQTLLCESNRESDLNNPLNRPRDQHQRCGCPTSTTILMTLFQLPFSMLMSYKEYPVLLTTCLYRWFIVVVS